MPHLSVTPVILLAILSSPGPFLTFRKGWGTSKLVVGTQVSPPEKLLGAWRGGPSVGQALLEGQTEKTQALLSFPSALHSSPPPFTAWVSSPKVPILGQLGELR